MRIVPLAISVLFAISPASVVCAQPAGAIDAVDVVRVNATVEKLNLENRKVTLTLEDGKHKTFRVDKSVQNLDQVKVGDHLKLAYTEEILIVVGKSSQAAGMSGAGMVSVVPKGVKPGGVMVETVSMTGKILAVDAAKQKVTIEEPDGKKKTVKISKKATNLDQLKVGETIDVGITEALAVEVVK